MKHIYPFPPAAMDEGMAAFFCGNLDVTSFRKYVAPYVATFKIGSRRAYLTRSLQDYMSLKAGEKISEANSFSTNPLDNLL